MRKLASQIVSDICEESRNRDGMVDSVIETLNSNIRKALVDADSELSAIAHCRPWDRDELIRISSELRKIYEGR